MDYRVYVVDDDSDYRDEVAERLTQTGYSVISSGTAEQFLDVFDPMQRGCILMDERMPGHSGSETLTIISKWLPIYPAILITGFASDGLADSVIKTGAFDIVEKPVSLSEIVLRVREALDWNEQVWRQYKKDALVWIDLQNLSPRDLSTSIMFADNQPSAVIAKSLSTNIRAIERSINGILEKMKAQSQAELAKMIKQTNAVFGADGITFNLAKTRKNGRAK